MKRRLAARDARTPPKSDFLKRFFVESKAAVLQRRNQRLLQTKHLGGVSEVKKGKREGFGVAMESRRKAVVGLKRKRMCARTIRTFSEKPREIGGGETELGRRKKVSNLYGGDDDSGVCHRSPEIRRDSAVDEGSLFSLSGPESFASVCESEQTTVSSDQQNLHASLQDEIQEFLKVWEDERSQLETDHKIESSLIRLMHGQSSIGISKKTLLENEFADKLEKHDLLKKQRLKELEEKHQASSENVVAAPQEQDPDGFPAEASSAVLADVVDNADCVESDAESAKEHTSALSEDLVKRRNEPDKIAEGNSVNDGQELFHTQRTLHIPDSCESLPHQNSAEIHIQDPPAVEIRSLPEAEVVRSGTLHNVGSRSSNLEVPLTGPVSVTVPSNENLPDTELRSLGINLPLAAEANIGEALLNQSPSVNDGNPEMQMDFNRQAVNDVAPAHCAASSVSHDSVAKQQVINAAEVQNQGTMPVGLDPNRFREHSDYPVNLSCVQASLWNSGQSSSAHLLQNELEKIRAETAALEMTYENMISQLKSDCQKEFSEIIGKYNLKIQETEEEFRLKQDELQRNQKKILMNQMLAELCRPMEPGLLFDFRQQNQPVSYPPSWTPRLGASGGSPAPRHGSYPASSSRDHNQTVPARPLAVHHASPTRPSSSARRPPTISSIPAAHLQPFRSSSTAPARNPAVYSSPLRLRPQHLTRQPLQTFTSFGPQTLPGPQAFFYSPHLRPQCPPRHPQSVPLPPSITATSTNPPFQHFAAPASSNPSPSTLPIAQTVAVSSSRQAVLGNSQRGSTDEDYICLSDDA